MSCPYLNQCCDKDIKCATCMHGDRSYYVAYHEYPPDKWPDKRELLEQPYPSPTSVEWPYLPSGDDWHYLSTGDGCGTPLVTWGPRL